jgi:hypothetical protein
MATNNAWNTGALTADGQLIIGSTSGRPIAALLTPGAGINIVNASNSITISSTNSVPTTVVTGTSQTMASNNAYVSNNAGVVTFTLPATFAVGDIFQIMGLGAGGWAIAQNASQLIHFGNEVTTTGTGGSLASTNAFDSIILKAVVANTTLVVLGGPQGNITYV